MKYASNRLFSDRSRSCLCFGSILGALEVWLLGKLADAVFEIVRWCRGSGTSRHDGSRSLSAELKTTGRLSQSGRNIMGRLHPLDAETPLRTR